MRVYPLYNGSVIRGKTIRLYLVDGTATGTLTAEIGNWTGKVVVSPRSQLAAIAKREEVGRTGVYFLIGPDPNDTLRNRVYIGEGDSVIKRLALHDKDDSKDFWTRTIIVVSKDENLTKSHGRYLESRLIQLAQQARRASISNNTAPQTPAMPEPDIADMEAFLEHVTLILPSLGFEFLKQRPTVTPQTTVTTASEPSAESESLEESHSFKLTTRIGVIATARELDGEFVVLAGAKVRKHPVESFSFYNRRIREQLINDGLLVESTDNPDLLLLNEDTAFGSPSAAASVLMGNSANGRKEWKLADTEEEYGDWKMRQLRCAGV